MHYGVSLIQRLARLRLYPCSSFFFFNDTATTEIYTLSLHDALPIFDAGTAVPVAVNVSARQLRHPSLAARERAAAPVCRPEPVLPRMPASAWEKRKAGPGPSAELPTRAGLPRATSSASDSRTRLTTR